MMFDVPFSFTTNREESERKKCDFLSFFFFTNIERKEMKKKM